MGRRIWIDLLNPSHPLFFKPVIRRLLPDHTIQVTVRDRAETVELARGLGIVHTVIGMDRESHFRKTLAVGTRAMVLEAAVKPFDVALSFENPMSVFVARDRYKKSILLLDNDLKYRGESGFIQRWESKVKRKADSIIVPECARGAFEEAFSCEVRTYPGYKEDIYIADHSVDHSILGALPFSDYVVIRPEAFASFYVEKGGSLVLDLIELFRKEGKNVVLLPRDKTDRSIRGGDNVHTPPTPLNGIDLIYHSSGVLTGSGTMARESAIMGKPTASFFPGEDLLTVDADMVRKGMMIHSRDPGELVEHIVGGKVGSIDRDSSSVQKEFMNELREELRG